MGLEAIALDLAAGVNESGLQEPCDRKPDSYRPLSADDVQPLERSPGNSDMGDDIPF